jgi:hypothetical protein
MRRSMTTGILAGFYDSFYTFSYTYADSSSYMTKNILFNYFDVNTYGSAFSADN